MWACNAVSTVALALLLTTGARAADLATADRGLLAAAADHDAMRVAHMLHADARWTTVEGRTLHAADLGTALSQPLIGGDAKAERHYHVYSPVGIVQVDAGKRHELRVWIEQPSGWQLLVHQEVQSLEAPPTTTPGAGADCDNPCTCRTAAGPCTSRACGCNATAVGSRR